MGENEVLGNALDGMELEDDSKSLPQVESPSKLKEDEKTAVMGDVTKAFNEHFNAHNVLAMHHFAEGSDEESDVEDVEMETDDSPSKPDSSAAEDTSNLHLGWARLLWKLVTSAKRWKNFPHAWKPGRLHCLQTPGQLLRLTFKSLALKQLLARLVTLRGASRLPSLCLRSALLTFPRWSFLPILLRRLPTLKVLALTLRRYLLSSRKV